MIVGGRLWCQHCGRVTRHTVESGVTDMGVVWQHERCGECRKVAHTHEAPADAAPTLEEAGLAGRRKHLEYARWLVRNGIVSDYPVIVASRGPATIRVGRSVVRASGFSVRGTIDATKRGQ